MRYITPWMKIMKIEMYFVDISKTFEKGWYDGLAFKLKQNGIHDNLLNTLEDFLRNRKQRVFLNEQTSNWENTHDEKIPVRPWLFLIYINNLAENLS